MFAALPPAPATAPAGSLEAAFVLARAAAAPSANPLSVLAGSGPVEEKLAAINALHSRLPTQPKARQAATLDALAAAAASAAQPPEVRAKALTYLGYSMPQADDDAARSRALGVLLAALKSPVYRIYALRGLGPASHQLPEADEARFQGALLDLLDGPVSGEERQTALVALHAFVAARDDLAKRDPALVAQLDARLLAPMEADPAGFAADARSTPGAREMAIAAVYWSARHRQALGDSAAPARVAAVLGRLAAVERDPEVRGWIAAYLAAAPPPPFRANTTKRAPEGPDAP